MVAEQTKIKPSYNERDINYIPNAIYVIGLRDHLVARCTHSRSIVEVITVG